MLAGLILFSCATTGQTSGSADKEPVPYEEGEFSPGLMKLRRGEVLLFGSLPLFYMFTSLGYDLAVQNPPDDTNTVLGHKMAVSVSLSGILALADFIVGEVRENREEKDLDL